MHPAQKAATGALAVFAAALATWLHVAGARQSVPRVWTEAVERRDVVATITARGRLMRARTRTLSAQVAGRVRMVVVRPGERVRAGQALVTFDPASARQDLARAHAIERAAIANVGNATAMLDQGEGTAKTAAATASRYEQLFALGLVSEDALAAARHDATAAALESLVRREHVAEARARAQAEQPAVAEAARAVSGSIERSPVDGIVGRILVREGQWVHPGGPHVAPTPLLTIAATGLLVETVVAQPDALRVPMGWPATVVIDAEPLRRWPGRVGAARDLPTGGVAVYVDVPASPDSAREGMSCTVFVTADARAGAVAVPNHALTSLGTSATVWTIRRGAIAALGVTLGLRGDQFTEVVSGLSPGQRVVTGPYAVLRAVRVGDAVIPASPAR